MGFIYELVLSPKADCNIRYNTDLFADGNCWLSLLNKKELYTLPMASASTMVTSTAMTTTKYLLFLF